MNIFKKSYTNMMVRLRKIVVDESTLRNMMFRWLNGLLALVAMFMTVINIFTAEYVLMAVTFVFGVACVLNIIICFRMGDIKAWLRVLFEAETILLIGFFFISGIPNGFSAQWICLIPPFALLVFGTKNGTVFSLIAFVMEIFLFWTPLGRSLLMYQYTNEFMLRFPFVYVAFYIITLFVETSRSETHKQLVSLEKRYEYLYRHDELTGILNRYGFDEAIVDILNNAEPQRSALMIIDIDNFKTVNDGYGHIAGDAVLKSISRALNEALSVNSTIARWGGEEFIVFIHGDLDFGICSEKLRKAAENAVTTFNGDTLKVTVSVGMCIIPDRITPEDMVRVTSAADKCLYKAKKNGKNRVESDMLN